MQKWLLEDHLTTSLIDDLYKLVTEGDEVELRQLLADASYALPLHLFTAFCTRKYDETNVNKFLESLCIIANILPACRQIVLDGVDIGNGFKNGIIKYKEDLTEESSIVLLLAVLRALLRNEPNNQRNETIMKTDITDLLLSIIDECKPNSNPCRYACCCILYIADTEDGDPDTYIMQTLLTKPSYEHFLESFLSLFNRSDSVLDRHHYLHFVERIVLLQGLNPDSHVIYTNDFYFCLDIIIREIRDLYSIADPNHFILSYLTTALIMIQSSIYNAIDSVTEPYKGDQIENLMRMILKETNPGSMDNDYFLKIKEGADIVLESLKRSQSLFLSVATKKW